jgi:hypothetical protein
MQNSWTRPSTRMTLSTGFSGMAPDPNRRPAQQDQVHVWMQRPIAAAEAVIAAPAVCVELRSSRISQNYRSTRPPALTAPWPCQHRSHNYDNYDNCIATYSRDDSYSPYQSTFFRLNVLSSRHCPSLPSNKIPRLLIPVPDSKQVQKKTCLFKFLGPDCSKYITY